MAEFHHQSSVTRVPSSESCLGRTARISHWNHRKSPIFWELRCNCNSTKPFSLRYASLKRAELRTIIVILIRSNELICTSPISVGGTFIPRSDANLFKKGFERNLSGRKLNQSPKRGQKICVTPFEKLIDRKRRGGVINRCNCCCPMIAG